MPLRLISGHLKVGKLDLNKAFRLFHELLTVNADTDFLKAVCRQRNDIAIAGHGIRALAILYAYAGATSTNSFFAPSEAGSIRRSRIFNMGNTCSFHKCTVQR